MDFEFNSLYYCNQVQTKCKQQFHIECQCKEIGFFHVNLEITLLYTLYVAQFEQNNGLKDNQYLNELSQILKMEKMHRKIFMKHQAFNTLYS